MTITGISLSNLLLVSFIFITSGAGASAAQIEIGSCTEIAQPGIYVLNQSITNSNSANCINITSSDVVFDGAGHIIDGVDNALTIGVYVHNSSVALTNVTVKNLNVTDWYYGIFYNTSTNGNITDNTASSNSYGIYLVSFSNSNTLRGNTASSNTVVGIHLDSYSNSNTLRGNTASLNTGPGILLVSSNNNILSSNSASLNGYGIYLIFSSNNNLRSNTASLNTIDGIHLVSSSNNNLSSNTASSNSYGIYLSSSSNSNTLRSNTASLNNYGIYLSSSGSNDLRSNIASSNSYGFYLDSSGSNNLRNNTASSNTAEGIHLVTSSNNTLSGNTALSNSEWAFYSVLNSFDNTVLNLDMNPTISFRGKDIALKSASSPGSAPAGNTDIGKFVNASGSSPDSWLFLNVSYSSGDVTGVYEDTLKLWRYNGSGWSQVGGSNVSMAQDYVYGNTTSFGIFASMGAPVSIATQLSGGVSSSGSGSSGSSISDGSSTSGGSSGGGGGGGGAGEAYDNIRERVVMYLMTVNIGSHIDQNITKGNTVVTRVEFDSIGIGSDIPVTIEELYHNSSLMSGPAPGRVYVNFNLYVNMPKREQDIKNSKIYFRVKNSWLAAHGFESGDIILYRFKNGTWSRVPLSVTGGDSVYIYFRGDTPGFSSYAISAEKVQSPTPTATLTGTPTATGAATGTAEGTKELPAYELVIATLGIAAAATARKHKGR